MSEVFFFSELLCREDSVEGEREEPDIPESQPSEYVPPPAPPKLKKEASTSKPGTPTHSTKCNTAKKRSACVLNYMFHGNHLELVLSNNIYIDVKPYFCLLYRSILKYRVMDVF